MDTLCTMYRLGDILVIMRVIEPEAQAFLSLLLLYLRRSVRGSK